MYTFILNECDYLLVTLSCDPYNLLSIQSTISLKSILNIYLFTITYP